MANDRQIAQLLLQVDANVAVAQRSLQDLARTVQQSTGDMNAAFGANDNAVTRTMTSHHQLGLAYNNTRIAQTELTAAMTRSIDAYGAGASPLRILSTEMGRLTEAASFLGGGAGNGVLGSMVRFIGGPWGIAILLGASVLAKLITAHHEQGDALDDVYAKLVKQKGQTALNAQAEEIWANSLDGLIERSTKLNETLEKRLQTQTDLQRKTLAQAQADYSAAYGAAAKLEANPQSTTQAQYDKAQAAISKTAIALHNAQVLAGQDAGEAIASITKSADVWAESQLSIMHALQGFHPELTEKGTADQMSAAYNRLKEAVTQAASAGVNFNETVHKTNSLNVQLRDGTISATKYTTSMNALAKQLEAVAEAAKNAKKGTGELGKQIGFSEAEAIAKGAGLTVTSGYRPAYGHGTPGHQTQEDLYNNPAYNRPGNPVARPGASAHNGLNGKWALDIAFAPGITAESLKKLYGDQGVSLSAVYKESGHYHIEGSTSRATAAQTAAARAAQKQLTDDDQFAKESAQLDAQILAARRSLAAGYDTQAKYADDEIDAQKKEQLDATKKQADAHQISAAQKKILDAKIEELASAKKAVVDHHAYIEALDQLAAAAKQQRDFQLGDLKFADDMARTAADRRKIELEILDIQYQQKDAELKRLQDLLTTNKDWGKSKALQDEFDALQAQRDHLPTELAQDQARTRQGTMSPLEAWAHQVPQTAALINEALQSIEVQGIDGLASSITDVITGTKTLGQAFGQVAHQIIADIIQMTVKMLIFKAISSVLGSIGGGGGGGLDASSINSSLGLDSGIPGFANGGIFGVGGNGGVDRNVLSINGVPRAKVSANENIAVLPRTPRISTAGTISNGPQQVELLIRTAPSDDAWAKVENISARTVGQAAPVIVRAARDSTVKSLSRPRLR